MVPQNTEKNQHLRKAHLQNFDFPRKDIFTSNNWDGFQLNSLNRNEGKPKITATTLASGKLSGSAISMLSDEFVGKKLSRDGCPASSVMQQKDSSSQNIVCKKLSSDSPNSHTVCIGVFPPEFWQ